MSAATADEREVIHHVDSAFGILLAIVVFQSNLIANLLRGSNSQRGEIFAIALSLLLIFAILNGLVGILKQSWPLKLLAWHITLTLLLWEFASLLVGVMPIQMSDILVFWRSGVPLVVLLLLSSMLTRSMVFRAYERRLHSVAPKGIEIEILRLHKNGPLWVGVIVAIIMLVMMVCFPLS